MTDVPGSASIATVVRVAYAKELTETGDYLYNFYDIAIWSTVECGMALLASSLATLKPLCRKMNAIFTTTRQTSAWDSDNSVVNRHNRHPHNGKVVSHRTQSSFSAYVPPRISIPGVRKASISVPQAVRWNHTIASDEIAMIPRTPASDVQSPASSTPSYKKMWEDDIV